MVKVQQPKTFSFEAKVQVYCVEPELLTEFTTVRVSPILDDPTRFLVDASVDRRQGDDQTTNPIVNVYKMTLPILQQYFRFIFQANKLYFDEPYFEDIQVTFSILSQDDTLHRSTEMYFCEENECYKRLYTSYLNYCNDTLRMLLMILAHQ